MFPGGSMPYYGAQSYGGAMGYGSPYAMPYVMAQTTGDDKEGKMAETDSDTKPESATETLKENDNKVPFEPSIPTDIGI